MLGISACCYPYRLSLTTFNQEKDTYWNTYQETQLYEQCRGIWDIFEQEVVKDVDEKQDQNIDKKVSPYLLELFVVFVASFYRKNGEHYDNIQYPSQFMKYGNTACK